MGDTVKSQVVDDGTAGDRAGADDSGGLVDATGYDARAVVGGEADGEAATVGRPTDEGGGGKLGMPLAGAVEGSEKGGTALEERRGGTGGGEGVRGSGLQAAASMEAGMMPPLLDGRRGSSSFSSDSSLSARDGVLTAGGEVDGRWDGGGVASSKRITSGSSLLSSSSSSSSSSVLSSSVPSSSPSSSFIVRCLCSSTPSSASSTSSSLISTGSRMLVMDGLCACCTCMAREVRLLA